MDIKHELLKLEIEARAAIADIERNNLGIALDRVVSVVDGLEKLQKQIEK